MNVVRPVHSSRVSQFLEDNDVVFNRPSDHRFEAFFANSTLVCDLSHPDICQIAGTWDTQVSNPDDVATLFHLISRCNSTRFVPKAYTLPGTFAGAVRLGAESNIPIVSGLTEDQFYSFLETAATAIIGFFGEAERSMPHLAKLKDPSSTQGAPQKDTHQSRGVPGFGRPGRIDVIRGGGTRA